ncbi:MAG: LysR substrate-binding domain-containing protein [Actinomycetes bacterium]
MGNGMSSAVQHEPGGKWPRLPSLELLVLVAELGSIGKAAERQGVSQASASRALDTLERELRLQLLVRTRTGSRLTPHGQLVVDWARACLTAVTDLLGGTEALRQEARATLRVAASMTVAEYLVPGWLVALRHVEPEVRVGLEVANSEGVADLVRRDTVDIGFIESVSMPRDVSGRRFATDRLTVVVGPLHPWARRRRPLLAAELAATRLVVREPGSGTRTSLEQLLGRRHALQEPLLELSSNTAVKVAVESGEAPAVLSRLAVAQDVEAGRLVEVPIADVRLDRPLRAVWQWRRRLRGPAEALAHIAVSPRSSVPSPPR